MDYRILLLILIINILILT